MQGRNRALRIVFGIVFGVIGLVLLTLISVYFILKSPSMQQKIIHSLKEPLAAQGVDLEVRSLSIDLLAGVNLQGLKVRINRAPEITGQAAIEDIRLGYAIWPLFRKRLVVREAKLSGIDGEFSLNLPPSPPEPPPDPEALTRLLEMLRHPPATLDLPEFALEKVKLHIKLVQGPLTADVLLDSMNLKAALAVDKGVNSLKLDAFMPLTVSLAKGDELKFSSRILLEPHLTWSSTLLEQDLTWSLKVDDTRIALDESHIALAAEQRLADIKTLKLALSAELEHKGLVPKQTVTVLDLALPLSAEGQVDLDATPLSFTDKISGTQGSVVLGTQLKFEANLPANLKKPEDVNWTLDNDLRVEALNLWKAKQKLLSLPQLTVGLKGKGDQGKGRIALDVHGEKINLNALEEALALKTTVEADIDLPGRGLDLKTLVSLNGQSALDLKAKVSDVQNTLTAKVSATVNTYPSWRKLHKGLAALDQIGWPKAVLETDLKVDHVEPLEETKDWSKLTITNSLVMDVVQTSGAEKALVAFKNLHLKNTVHTLEKKIKGQLSLNVSALKHEALKKTVAAEQTLDYQADIADYLSVDLKGLTRIDGKELLQLALNAKESPRKLTINNRLTAYVDPSLKAYVDGLAILDDVGRLTLESNDAVVLNLSAQRLADVKSWEPEQLNLSAKSSQKLSQAAAQVKYRLYQALTVDTDAKLSKGQLDVTTRVKAPSLEAQDLAKVDALGATVDLKVNSIKTLDHVGIDFNSNIKSVRPLMASAEKVQDVIQNVSVTLKAQMLQKDKFVVEDLKATVDGALMAFNGKGDMALSTGRGGFQGSLRTQLPAGRNIAGIQGTGGFELPFTITLYDKKVLAIQSEPRFDKLSFTFGDIEIEGMDGRLSLSEELSIDEKSRVGFLYLNTQNPFTRVDFENIDPYLSSRQSLKIGKARFKHIVTGPFLANIELRQNLILLNEMKANLLNGSALGRVFVDLHPERLQLGFLGRFSNLQLELLKEPALRKAVKDELSGRAASNFDIRKRLATGRIDVTSIGRNQLLSMIDVLDPQYKDTQMMNARRGLQISYPRLVSLSMEQGLMDLMIGLGGALSTDISVRSIPLTAFINANAGEQLLTLEKFLQTGGQ